MDVNKLDIHSFLKLRNMIANCIGKKSSLQLWKASYQFLTMKN